MTTELIGGTEGSNPAPSSGESRANPKKHVGDDVLKWHTSSELDILWLLQNGVNAYLPVERSRIRRDWRAIMTEGRKPRLIGINHVAIEVGNIDEALDWYGQIFDFKLRGKGERNAFPVAPTATIGVNLGHPQLRERSAARLRAKQQTRWRGLANAIMSASPRGLVGVGLPNLARERRGLHENVPGAHPAPFPDQSFNWPSKIS